MGHLLITVSGEGKIPRLGAWLDLGICWGLGNDKVVSELYEYKCILYICVCVLSFTCTKLCKFEIADLMYICPKVTFLVWPGIVKD